MLERIEDVLPLPKQDRTETVLQVELVATQKQIFRRKAILRGYCTLAILALCLRAWFVLKVSTIAPVWDALEYWTSMVAARDAFCKHFGLCLAIVNNGVVPTLGAVLRGAAMDRRGIEPLAGVLLAALPVAPSSILLIYSALDTLVCLMVAGIARRLGAPLWVALLAGALQALYIPAITGDGAVLQQPPIRFLLASAIWAYTWAFTSNGRRSWVWTGLGSLALLGLGFANLTNRPFMWLFQFSVIALSLLGPRLRSVLHAQLIYSGLTFVFIGILSITIFSVTKSNDALTVPFVGLSSHGSVKNQTTVLSFENFWGPDEWEFIGRNTTHSIVGDVIRAPLAFAQWWDYSLFANWRYPDYPYFQSFLLDLHGQQVQHEWLVLLGLAGLIGLLGYSGAKRRVAILILFAGMSTSLMYSMISVEPRRVSVLSPFLALGVGMCCWGLVSLLKHGLRKQAYLQQIRNGQGLRWAWISAAAIVLGICLLWAIPIQAVLNSAPGMAGILHTCVVLARAATLLIGVVLMCLLFKRLITPFNLWLPISCLTLIVGIVTIAELMDTDWRAWSTPVASGVRQTVHRIEVQAHLQPWLLIDAVTTEGLESAAIYVNNKLIKPPGAMVFTWRAGQRADWWAYTDLERMANPAPPKQTWLAIPLPPSLVQEAPITVEIRPGDRALSLRGDYLDTPSSPYLGPLLSPWDDGNAIWRWQWNGESPRIPAVQSFGKQDYSSSYRVKAPPGSDHVDTWAESPGLFRIFITWAAFSPRTNALHPLHSALSTSGPTPSPTDQVKPPICPKGDLLAGDDMNLPFACLVGDRITYYAAQGKQIGTFSAKRLSQHFAPNALVDQIKTGDQRVEVIGVMQGLGDTDLENSLYVANLYTGDGVLMYSTAFWLQLPPHAKNVALTIRLRYNPVYYM